MNEKQKILHGHKPSNINLGIFVCSFDVCRISWPLPSKNFEQTKTKTFIFVVALKRAILNGSTKSRFKIFLNFSYEEELTTNLVSSCFNTKSLWYKVVSIQNFKIPAAKIIIEFLHLELTNDTKCFCFVVDDGSSDFPSNRACFREEVQRIQLAEKVPRTPDKHDFSPSGITFFRSITVVRDAKRKKLSLGYFF